MSSSMLPVAVARRVIAALSIIVMPELLGAQTPSAQTSQDEPTRFNASVIVTAAKEPEDKQKLPISLTAVTQNTLDRMGATIVSDAAILAPNTLFTEFTARKLSNARFRGIGASQSIPGITTYIDGVPQFNANSSSLELIDVGQIEFVRGPQSTLFGRNTLGGLINVTSARPAQDTWKGMLSVPFGNFGSWSARGNASGPVIDGRLSLGVSFVQSERDGYTVNDMTGRDVDHRAASSVKAQALWTPNDTWEAQLIVSGERARDGDYGLNDLGALRSNPFHVSRNFEGRTDRDVLGTTFQTRRNGARVVMSTNTGVVRWEARDVTDLDYSPLAIATRDNAEEDFQFTQEVRFASAKAAPLAPGDRATMKWQAGAFFFTQNYKQNAVNHVASLPFLPVAVDFFSPVSKLDDIGIGVFGQGTATLGDRLDVTFGARLDYEDKNATLDTFSVPALGPAQSVVADKSFSNVSPQASVAYRVRPDQSIYASINRGFKAGGFNAASPAGREAFDEELAWHYEGGAKTLWLDGRVLANAAAFYIDWTSLQTFVPNPSVPGQFFVSNVGGAVSKGLELEINVTPTQGLDLFTSVGYTHARFADGSRTGGLDISGNKLQLTPDYTASTGIQYTRQIGQATAFGRADVACFGAFEYDDANTLGQEAYVLANFRAGVTVKRVVIEASVRNAFDKRYIPVLLPYPDFAPSGYLGEVGAPRTFRLSAGVRF